MVGKDASGAAKLVYTPESVTAAVGGELSLFAALELSLTCLFSQLFLSSQSQIACEFYLSDLSPIESLSPQQMNETTQS